MNTPVEKLGALKLPASVPRKEALRQIRGILEDDLGYEFSDIDESRPWGAFYRLTDKLADRFLADFFPGVDPLEAKLGNTELVLSPKILVVYPAQRLSWQYHKYRAERWRFLTAGGYHQSKTNEQGTEIAAEPGKIVQFETGERHRLTGAADSYTIVAEIWQHTDPAHPSEESDIIRVADDYKR